MKDLIIIGASGHAKVIADIAEKTNRKIKGFLDDNVKEFFGRQILGGVNDADCFKDKCEFVIAIGSNEFRKKYSQSHKLQYATLIHPSAQIGLDVHFGEGTVVMANTAVNSCARVGKHCIVNTGAVIEHDNCLADFVHISPNATLAGTVSIGELTHIGAAAVIINNISVCNNCTIGAGCVVINDITDSGVYVGNPARKIK